MFNQLVGTVLCAAAIAAGVAWLDNRPAPDAPGPAAVAVDQQRPATLSSAVARQPVLNGRRVEILKSPDGHFRTEVQLNNARLEVMVDTGASLLALRESDAHKAGLRPTRGDYTWKIETAGGTVMAARLPVRRLEIGSVRISDTQAFILPDDALSTNLLGMNVLSQFGTISLTGDRLVLDPQG